MTTPEVMQRLHGVKAIGQSSWMALCPAHDDKNPSLQISERPDGSTGIHCHAGCSPEAVVGSLGMKFSDLFPKGNKAAKRDKTLGPIVAEYLYRDEKGSPLFKVTRHMPKDFRQWRPDPCSKGGWAPGVNGVRRVLFRLPEVLAAVHAGRPIFVAEGEKDVLALVAAGVDATCNPCGSGNWLTAYTHSLAGAHIQIIADKDKSGREHAQKVASSVHGTAADVRVIEVPRGKDAAEFLESGGTIAELQSIADEAAEWTSKASLAAGPVPSEHFQSDVKSAAGKPGQASKPDVERVFVLPNDHCPISHSANRIFTAIAPTRTLFNRGGVIVELKKSTDGGISLSGISPEAFRSRIERYGHEVMAWRSDGEARPVLGRKNCSVDTARALLETKEAVEILPSISLLARSAVITENFTSGLVVASKGYTAEGGGILVTHGRTPPAVSLSEARERIGTLLQDFDFQTPADRSRAMAAIITPALRMGGLLRGFCPVDVVEATESQSGKGYLHRVIRAVYGESAHTIARKDGGVGGMDESLSAGLIAGRPFIELDNLRGKVDSQFLEMVLTLDGLVPCRVPHRGEVSVDASRVTFQATSNGMESTRDLANRSSITRIRKRPPGFKFAGFPEGDLVDHVKADPDRFLGAVFAVVQSWHDCGKPRSENAGHDFREWATTLDWIVTKLLGAAPLMDGHLAAQERVSNPALSWLRMVGLAVIKDAQPFRELSASELWELAQEHGIEHPRTPRESENGGLVVGQLMKRCFRDGNTLRLDDIQVQRITRLEVDEHRHERPVKSYSFAACDTCGMVVGDSGKPPSFRESTGSMPHTPQGEESR